MTVFWVVCLIDLAAVIMVLGEAAAIRPLLFFNPGAGGRSTWTLGSTERAHDRLRLIVFCSLR
jgi:hypothetical protein